jgi:hypothetical protein
MMTAESRGTGKKVRRRDSNGGRQRHLLEQAAVHEPEAARAYRWSIYSMIPLVGLLLGPLAMVLGLKTLRTGRKNPAFSGRPLCWAAVIIGLAVTLTQWGGLALMIRGWQGE